MVLYLEVEGGRVAAGRALSPLNTGYSPSAMNVRYGLTNAQQIEHGFRNASNSILYGQYRHLRLVVNNGKAALYLDGGDAPYFEVALDQSYQGGYISLFANNNYGTASYGFRNLSITPLPDDTDPDPDVYTSLLDPEDMDGDFNAYRTENGVTTKLGSIAEGWKAQGGRLLANPFTNESGAAVLGTDLNQVSMLTYTGQEFTNFELTVEFQQRYQHHGIVFGAPLGEYPLSGTASNVASQEGAAILYIEMEGGRVAVGDALAYTNANYTANTQMVRRTLPRDEAVTLGFYDRDANGNDVLKAGRYHCMRLVVKDGTAKVYLDGNAEPYFEVLLDTIYTGGYISLFSSSGSDTYGLRNLSRNENT